MSSTAYGDTHADDPAAPPPALTLTHQDLLNTANELYRRMEDPGFAQDDAYWTSLPVHLRNFIRNALPLAGNVSTGDGVLPGGVGKAGGQRAMYALAQQIVSAANTGMGAGVSAAAAAGYGNAGYAIGIAQTQPPPPPPPPTTTPRLVAAAAAAPPPPPQQTQQMSLDDIASMPPDAVLYPRPRTTSTTVQGDDGDEDDVGKGYGFHPHPDHRRQHDGTTAQDGIDSWGNARRGRMPGGFVRADDE
ncbi:hypothetical protein QFC19_001185 [Naganishia cerealis]|uniref:Uncharacterized protein n=1 Tax=Naganishia cerealis TaxID=610337 RepID=A0ACC2WKS3_9TREE|nr:hypothetical protein QFC19_001185 [Naganishia cerealis]